jgi:hypothetical protein
VDNSRPVVLSRRRDHTIMGSPVPANVPGKVFATF